MNMRAEQIRGKMRVILHQAGIYRGLVKAFGFPAPDPVRVPFLVTGLCAIVVFLINCEVCRAETSAVPGNFKNPDAVQRVLSGKETVANAAWWGFDETDSTAAIQGAINSGASKVIIPYVGKEWIVQPIMLAGNQEINFEPGVVVVAKKGSFKGTHDCLFSSHYLNNITLRGYGATLRMRKDDYKNSKYIKSEHRHVLEFRSSNNINVFGLRLENSGGDGIFLGSTKEKPFLPCRDSLIRDCTCDGNYRQGITVTSADKLLVENCVLRNTKGTSPQAGIDIEPWHPDNVLINVVVSNCISEHNGGSGFFINVSYLNKQSRDVSVLFVNCYSRNSYAPGFAVSADNPKKYPGGLIEFRDCIGEGIAYSGASVIWKLTSPLKLRFNNCKFRNVAAKRNKVPINLMLKRTNAVSQAGGIEFVNCYVYDEKNRPFLRITDVESGEGVYDVKGDINVFNAYGARIDSGRPDEKLVLKVNSFKRW